MFRRIATGIAKWLLQQGAISSADLNLYIYAIDTFMFSVIPLFLTMSIGLALNMVLESILMIFPFMLIRKFSGGFHLRSQVACLLLSLLLLLTILLIIKWSISANHLALCTVLTFFSSISLCLLSPIDSDQRKLSTKEKVFFKRLTLFFVFFFDILYVIFYSAGKYRISLSLGYGIFIPAILQVPILLQTVAKHNLHQQNNKYH